MARRIPASCSTLDAVVDSAAGLPVDVELAELRERVVPGADRPALDSVVLFRTR